MSNVLTQFPSGITLKMIEGNDLTFRVKWGFDITDYTFTSKIIPSNGTAEIAITVTTVDVPTGQIDLTIEGVDVSALPKNANHTWYLDWSVSGANVRTVLGGILVIYPKNTILKQVVEV